MPETLGQRIARLREAAGLTQKQLAERAAVPVGTMRNWEQDIREPLASAVAKLARAMGISTADILDAETAEPRPSHDAHDGTSTARPKRTKAPKSTPPAAKKPARKRKP